MKVFKLNLFKLKNKKLLVFCLLVINSILNAQSVTGTRGLVHIPTAELFEDKTFVLGASYIPKGYFIRFNQSVNPGMPTYATLTLFPFMEVMFRYTNELNLKVNPETKYFPDRMMVFRIKALNESTYRPSILIGLQDMTGGFGLSSSKGANNYPATYVVATKNFKYKQFKVSTTTGYAFDFLEVKTKDHKGLFGGVELSYEKLPEASFMIEHDSYVINTGVKYFAFNHLQLMVGLWDLKKLTANLSFRYQL